MEFPKKIPKIGKFCWFGHCIIQINKEVDINLLVFTKVTKSIESVIAMHQSTEICWLFVDLVKLF